MKYFIWKLELKEEEDETVEVDGREKEDRGGKKFIEVKQSICESYLIRVE